MVEVVEAEERLSFIEFLAAVLNEPPMNFTLEFIGSTQHQGAWSDIVAKAKRLIMSGNVTILRNAPHHIMAHVIGDHGEYNCEISRHDPTAQLIEQWACECPWDQYAFDRTRKWKGIEGRVCSHVLAAYWKAKGTPLDMQDQDSGYIPPRGQNLGPVGPGQQQIPSGGMGFGETPPGVPYDKNAEQPTAPTQQDIVVPQQPASPFNIQPKVPTKPQIEQLHLFDITAPPGMQPVPPMNPVSIPGGRPPTPGNPVQFPGTFSHFIPLFTVQASEFHYGSDDDFGAWIQAERSQGRTPIVILNRPVTLEQRGGKIPMPGAQPIGYTPEGVAQYQVLDLGYDPMTQQRVPANTPPAGAPEQQGVYSDAAGGKRAEVLDYEPSLGMIYVNVPLRTTGPLHPHSLVGWVDVADVRAAPGATTPARMPRR